MEHNIINQSDGEYLKFLSNLRKLSKDELVDFIGDYWIELKEQAINQMNDKRNDFQAESGAIKMTQVNRLKFKAMIEGKKK